MPVIARLSALVLAGVIATLPLSAQEGFRFTSGVELVNVTATVTGRDGRFLTGLTVFARLKFFSAGALTFTRLFPSRGWPRESCRRRRRSTRPRG